MEEKRKKKSQNDDCESFSWIVSRKWLERKESDERNFYFVLL
jgi:hypothetical protein